MRNDHRRGAVAIITNPRGDLLPHLRDDIPAVCWSGYWSRPGRREEPRKT
ncbi:hypothetical protein HNR23_002199 [Nocardiopsis mwathae]|uniref:Uncharacterized protein n=1 Tax=Nocardiopsis mwathae TaxID=1472723 RepID=A0A7W9YHE9_9ACTN|nr:hypothetical protein [Nocardiopsis mwathae]MBB6172139.1 hypothetical protein [Nocardiopsis mwathae]